MNKAKLNGKIYNVVNDTDDYFNNPMYFNDDLIAIKNDDTVYPVRKSVNMYEPGVYFNDSNTMCRFVHPSKEEANLYTAENIIDFDSSESIKDLIEKSDKLNNLKREILLNPDDIFSPSIMENDSSEMKILKEAIHKKHIDINKYEDRFGASFLNDKRKISNGNSMTLVKLKSTCEALDIKVTLTLEDENDNVPNPIGEKLSIQITGGGNK